MGLRLKLLLLAAVAVTAYVVLNPAQQGTSTVEAAVSTRTGASGNQDARPRSTSAMRTSEAGSRAAARSGFSMIAATERVADAHSAPALFASHSWYVAPPPPPPPPPVIAAAPPPPTAPPLPFAYMGSYQPDGQSTVFFLTDADRVYEARVGDVLDNTYSVDAVRNGQLWLTYKPLNIQQSLTLGTSP